MLQEKIYKIAKFVLFVLLLIPVTGILCLLAGLGSFLDWIAHAWPEWHIK